jgi:hypothetical protein
MSVVLARNWGNNITVKRRAASEGRAFVLKKSMRFVVKDGQTSFNTIIFIMIGCLIFAGAFYLYQVNNITIKGYEIKEVENKIQNLEKESQKLKIREVESRSMYNIEKATEDLNLVNSANVSYVEMKGPMAMK